MFLLYRYGRRDKPTRFPRKDLLLGYDSISKGSHWSPSSKTKGTEENPLTVVGESPEQDASDTIVYLRTVEDVEKKTKATGENLLKVVGESPEQDALDKIFRPRTDKGAGKKNVVTVLVEDDNPEG
jgi:hypothetical protein